MAQLEETPAWQALLEHQQEIGAFHMRDLFAEDPQRFEKFSLHLGDILFDYSKNRITERRCRCCWNWRSRPGWGCG